MRTDADWEWEQLLLQMYQAKHMGIDLTVVQHGVNEERYQAAFRDWDIISRVWSMKAILAREARRNAN